MLNFDRLAGLKKNAAALLDKTMAKSVQTLDNKIAQISNKRQERKAVNQLEPTSENASIIDFLCLFAFKYQRSWTAEKQMVIDPDACIDCGMCMVIDQHCLTEKDINYFAELRFDNVQKYSIFNVDKAKKAFGNLRVAKSNARFEDWVELQKQIVTDVLHLLALSKCSSEEIYKECMTFPFLFNVSEDVCLTAYYQQQSEQQNKKSPYYG